MSYGSKSEKWRYFRKKGVCRQGNQGRITEVRAKSGAASVKRSLPARKSGQDYGSKSEKWSCFVNKRYREKHSKPDNGVKEYHEIYNRS